MTIQLHRTIAVHPGQWVKAELVDPIGLSVTALAEALHVSRQAASAVLNGSAGVSAEMAIRLEKAFGVRADTLVRMQAAYDLNLARAGESRIKVERLAAA